MGKTLADSCCADLIPAGVAVEGWSEIIFFSLQRYGRKTRAGFYSCTPGNLGVVLALFQLQKSELSVNLSARNVSFGPRPKKTRKGVWGGGRVFASRIAGCGGCVAEQGECGLCAGLARRAKDVAE